MLRSLVFALLLQSILVRVSAQEYLPFDTAHWDIKSQGHVVETYHGKDAIYISQGFASLKNEAFKNGTIEFDIYLTERRSFPGIGFRTQENGNAESFYFRTTQSGKADANQAVPVFNRISAWQLYFGSAYSFVYDYPFDRWMHVKLAIKDQQAQIYLDGANQPTFSWNLKQEARHGGIRLGGLFAPMHYANVQVDRNEPVIVDFNVRNKEKIEGIITEWQVSDKFKEELLDNVNNAQEIIGRRSWLYSVKVDDSNAANLSRVVSRPDNDGNTVMVKLNVLSDKDQINQFHFGYSDRVIAYCNGQAIYKGTNAYRSRDFRYLGTIGLFDSIYVNLKEGENTLIFAVSESFGGWGIMGKFEDYSGIIVK